MSKSSHLLQDYGTLTVRQPIFDAGPETLEAQIQIVCSPLAAGITPEKPWFCPALSTNPGTRGLLKPRGIEVHEEPMLAATLTLCVG